MLPSEFVKGTTTRVTEKEKLSIFEPFEKIYLETELEKNDIYQLFNMVDIIDNFRQGLVTMKELEFYLNFYSTAIMKINDF